MPKMSEAMALASINPVVGVTPTNSYMIKTDLIDKDLEDTKTRKFTGVTQTLDTDDDMYSLDKEGKTYALPKSCLIGKNLEIYGIISPGADQITEALIKESHLPYEKRPKHSCTLYEMYTSKELLTEDQIDFDPVFEKVELEKMSNAINGVTVNQKAFRGLAYDSPSKPKYVPDTGFPLRTDELTSLGEEDLDMLKDVSESKFDIKDDSMYNVDEATGYSALPIIFSDDDIYVNFDKFVSGESHVCFIHGLSGSGKTTLGNKLAEKYKAYYVEIDVIAFKICGNCRPERHTYDYIQAHDLMLYRYMKEKQIPPNFMNDIEEMSMKHPDPTYEEESKKKMRIKDYIHWLVFEQTERVVIGGGYAGITYAEDYRYWDEPIIIKGTSLGKSMIRRLQRMSTKTDNIIDFIGEVIKRIPVFYSQYSRMYSEVNNTRRAIMMNNEFTYVKENTTLDPNVVTDRFGNVKIRSGSGYSGIYPDADEKEWVHKIEYIGHDKWTKGIPQPCIKINGGLYRARCEIMVIKGNQVLLDMDRNRGGFGYALPGGGLDKNESIAHCAERECKEEALVLPVKVRYTNVAWTEDFNDPKFNKGAISFVCIAEYGKEYKGKVKAEDRDEFADRAIWINIEDIELGEPHRIALDRYMDSKENTNRSMSYQDSFINRINLSRR